MSDTHSPALVVGASRGLGLALVKYLHSLNRPVIATVRSTPEPGTFPEGVKVLEGIDVGEEKGVMKIVEGLEGVGVGLVVVVSGVAKKETFEEPNWEAQLQMYTICSISPVFIISHLFRASLLLPSAKIIIVTSEAGSLALRTQSEGGGMFAHHGSKAAANMVGRLLGFDLRERGVVVAMIHPGFLKTEMTSGMGFDEFYDEGGAIEPEEACPGIVKFIDNLQLADTGKHWAPNGAKGIGGAEEVMGKDVMDKEGPLELPW